MDWIGAAGKAGGFAAVGRGGGEGRREAEGGQTGGGGQLSAFSGQLSAFSHVCGAESSVALLTFLSYFPFSLSNPLQMTPIMTSCVLRRCR